MKAEDAVATFRQGFNCAQAVLAAYGPVFGLARGICLKIGSAFGGGIAHRGEMCGAVIGALMVISLASGKDRSDDRESGDKTYRQAEMFIREFIGRNGSPLCRELIECDISTPEGIREALEKKLFETVCPRLVQDASEILEGVLKGIMP